MRWGLVEGEGQRGEVGGGEEEAGREVGAVISCISFLSENACTYTARVLRCVGQGVGPRSSDRFAITLPGCDIALMETLQSRDCY
jgi:hypothetical protein